MNIYMISQTVNNGYDTYDSAIVCASSTKKAMNIHPNGRAICRDGIWYKIPRSTYEPNNLQAYNDDTWCELYNVQVKFIGKAAKNLKEGVILSSFNAG